MNKNIIPSHQLTWKCTDPCRKTTFLLERAFLHFHVGGYLMWFPLLGNPQVRSISRSLLSNSKTRTKDIKIRNSKGNSAEIGTANPRGKPRLSSSRNTKGSSSDSSLASARDGSGLSSKVGLWTLIQNRLLAMLAPLGYSLAPISSPDLNPQHYNHKPCY